MRSGFAGRPRVLHPLRGWLVLVLSLFAWAAVGCTPPDIEGGLALEDRGPQTPPELEDPETVVLTSDEAHARLERGRDYVVELAEPIESVGGVIISGGRNVVLVGGHITIPWAGSEASAADRRGLFLRWQSGTVHIEGVLIDNQGGDLSEGIQINAPNARVQLVNLRVDGVHARDEVDFSDNHPDIIQPWGGVGELWVSGLTGVTGYQGIFLKADQNSIGRVVLDRVNLTGLPASRYLLWATPDIEVEMNDVWIQPASGRSWRITVRPEPPDPFWVAVQVGQPTGGDFVPASSVGHGYPAESAAHSRAA